VTRPAHILSIDVEEWVHFLEPDAAPPRLLANTERLLDRLALCGARATCFVGDWIAGRHPELARRIASAGHELASHAFWQPLLRDHDAASFAAELADARKRLEDLAGTAVRGFRAPGASLAPRAAWPFEVLVEQGFRYDASLDPRGAPRGPHVLRLRAGSLVEIPTLPFAGGPWLRVLPPRWIAARLTLEHGLGRAAHVSVHARDVDRATESALARLLPRARFVGAGEWLRERRPDLIGRELDLRALET
jgi:peptidoglycan/xylan/chitin deacetylase (PgdA/CDA1 family)